MSRKDLKALTEKIDASLGGAERESKGFRWSTLIASLIIGGMAGAGPLVAAIADIVQVEPIMCTESYERAAEMHGDGLPLPTYPDESPEQQQCDMNRYIEKELD